MKLLEYRVKKGELSVPANEKVLSFGIDKGTVYFWTMQSDNKNPDVPDGKYLILENNDDIPENYHHVTTLIDEMAPKHIFIEYIEPAKTQMTKVITDQGIETFEEPLNEHSESENKPA